MESIPNPKQPLGILGYDSVEVFKAYPTLV
jgi:hypothetical protein